MRPSNCFVWHTTALLSRGTDDTFLACMDVLSTVLPDTVYMLWYVIWLPGYGCRGIRWRYILVVIMRVAFTPVAVGPRPAAPNYRL